MPTKSTSGLNVPTRGSYQVWSSVAVPPWATLNLTASSQFSWTCYGTGGPTGFLIVTGGSNRLPGGVWQVTIDVGLVGTVYGWVDAELEAGTDIEASYNWS